jgi:hypothetical protein
VNFFSFLLNASIRFSPCCNDHYHHFLLCEVLRKVGGKTPSSRIERFVLLLTLEICTRSTVYYCTPPSNSQGLYLYRYVPSNPSSWTISKSKQDRVSFTQQITSPLFDFVAPRLPTLLPTYEHTIEYSAKGEMKTRRRKPRGTTHWPLSPVTSVSSLVLLTLVGGQGQSVQAQNLLQR